MAGFVERLQKMWNPPEDEYEEYYDEPEEAVRETHRGMRSEERDISSASTREYMRRQASAEENGNKVVNIHATTQLQVVVFRPERFGEETRTIADELLKMHTVVLNLENTNKDISRRIIDFLSGVAYANNGKIKRIATGTFIITPYNVDLKGDDVIDELENNGVYF